MTLRIPDAAGRFLEPTHIHIPFGFSENLHEHFISILLVFLIRFAQICVSIFAAMFVFLYICLYLAACTHPPV